MNPASRTSGKRALLVGVAFILVAMIPLVWVFTHRKHDPHLSDMGIVPQHIVCNQIYPAHFPAGAPVARVLDALAADRDLTPPLREVTEHATLSRDRRALNERYLGELRARAKTPVHELPMLFTPALDAVHVKALGDRL